jgi:hypothetical protein
MACAIFLRTDLLTGADTGGEWTYDGYSIDNTTFGAGGTAPGALVGDNPELDVTGWTPGFYKFTYAGGTGECADEVSTILAVIASPDAGCTPDDITYCEGEGGSGVNLLTLKNDECEEEITNDDLTIEWDGVSDDPGAAFSAGSLDIEDLPVGTYTFTFTKTATVPGGFTLSECENCEASEATLTIIITENFTAGTANSVAVCP